ncbi:hypothetical protein [Rhodomicrobium lacus]|uniref:hypothetical protein n=1 Tax=Rhodomicrobium lacus TaxID=2498452 RepID=UPI000F8D93B0|nr:hypothetical protein [Rhodomicrobium lacus]
MILLSAISYAWTQTVATAFAAWADRLARAVIIGVLILAALLGIRAWAQYHYISRAAIEQVTQAAEDAAVLERTRIEAERNASEQADAAALEQRAAELEKARHESTPQTQGFDTVVLPADDSWLRGKTGDARRR